MEPRHRTPALPDFDPPELTLPQFEADLFEWMYAVACVVGADCFASEDDPVWRNWMRRWETLEHLHANGSAHGTRCDWPAAGPVSAEFGAFEGARRFAGPAPGRRTMAVSTALRPLHYAQWPEQSASTWVSYLCAASLDVCCPPGDAHKATAALRMWMHVQLCMMYAVWRGPDRTELDRFHELCELVRRVDAPMAAQCDRLPRTEDSSEEGEEKTLDATPWNRHPQAWRTWRAALPAPSDADTGADASDSLWLLPPEWGFEAAADVDQRCNEPIRRAQLKHGRAAALPALLRAVEDTMRAGWRTWKAVIAAHSARGLYWFRGWCVVDTRYPEAVDAVFRLAALRALAQPLADPDTLVWGSAAVLRDPRHMERLGPLLHTAYRLLTTVAQQCYRSHDTALTAHASAADLASSSASAGTAPVTIAARLQLPSSLAWLQQAPAYLPPCALRLLSLNRKGRHLRHAERFWLVNFVHQLSSVPEEQAALRQTVLQALTEVAKRTAESSSAALVRERELASLGRSLAAPAAKSYACTCLGTQRKQLCPWAEQTAGVSDLEDLVRAYGVPMAADATAAMVEQVRRGGGIGCCMRMSGVPVHKTMSPLRFVARRLELAYESADTPLRPPPYQPPVDRVVTAATVHYLDSLDALDASVDWNAVPLPAMDPPKVEPAASYLDAWDAMDCS